MSATTSSGVKGWTAIAGPDTFWAEPFYIYAGPSRSRGPSP